MKKDLYVNITNLKITHELVHHCKFRGVPEYDSKEFSELHRNEYGMFQIDDLNIRVLLGQLSQPNCPWCDSEPEIIIKDINIQKDPCVAQGYIKKIYMKCPECKSEGPHTILTINDYREKFFDRIKELIKQKYSQRVKWDEKFNYKE